MRPEALDLLRIEDQAGVVVDVLQGVQPGFHLRIYEHGYINTPTLTWFINTGMNMV